MTEPAAPPSATTTANVSPALRPAKVVTAKQHTAYRIANGKAAAANRGRGK